jgi:hypothetical protein
MRPRSRSMASSSPTMADGREPRTSRITSSSELNARTSRLAGVPGELGSRLPALLQSTFREKVTPVRILGACSDLDNEPTVDQSC